MPPELARAAVESKRTIFLIDTSSRLETRLIEDFIAARYPEASETVVIPSSRRPRRRRPVSQLEAYLGSDDDAILAPLRVAWLAGERRPGRLTGLLRLLLLGDPRDPGRFRQRWIARRHPGRVRVVEAEPAPVSELRKRWQRAGAVGAETTGLADFVTRQAYLALERAERRIRGSRYKVPRFVREEILSRASFLGGITRLAHELGREEDRILREASRYLREIAASHSPYVIDITAQLIRLMYTQAYGEALHYDRAALERIATLSQRHPVVFLPSHKSNLDHLVLQYALHENGHPPNHTAGGINMNFFPVGPLARRSGVFFIRRTFKDNPVYKFVLHHYIDYLIEKRFTLEWYIEGGRSRSGKLLPPRFGMLAYVVDAYRRGKSDDVYLVPVAIAYDQIQDVGDYTAEQRGAAKQTESFGWLVRVVRGFRRRFGDIHIRFGEPISLADAIGPPAPQATPNPDEQSLAIQKLAFEVAVRINRATPITPTSLVALAMLGCGDRALTVDETVRSLHNLVHYVRRCRLPTTVPLQLDDPDGVLRTLDMLVENGVVTCYDEGPEAVYAIGPDQHLTAAYYRNTIIHFFVNGAIAELALLRASEPDVRDGQQAFWDEAMALRDLLKFEFFFAEKDEFRAEIGGDMALHDADWERQTSAGPEALRHLLRRVRPFSSHRVLQPYLDAYQVVGDALARDPVVPRDTEDFLRGCLATGRQYQLQRRIRSAESVSRVLFETALRLAGNRRLLDADGDVGAAREAFAEEIRRAVRRAEIIGGLAASRRAGLET